MFVVLEGIDGCGKNTHMTLLRSDYDFTAIKFPRKKFSILEEYLKGSVKLTGKATFLLFLADIVDGIEEQDFSRDVFSDRYVFSTIAYEVDGIGFEEAKAIIRVVQPKKPDGVILIDIPAEVSLERKSRQKELDKYEKNLEYLSKVRENFLSLYKERFYTPNWFLIDGNRPIMEVYEDVKKAVEEIKARIGKG